MSIRHKWLFHLLIRLHCPNGPYYWLLDRLTDDNGWRPLSMRDARPASAGLPGDDRGGQGR